MRDNMYEHGDRKIEVRTEGMAGPYLMIEPEQVKAVCGLLQENGITFDVRPKSLMQDKKPAGTVIDLGSMANVDHIQSILDSVE